MKTISLTEPYEIEEIIRSCNHCMLGLTDTEGNPYVIPMNFAYADGTIYLHTGPTGGKLAMIAAHPRVCVTFCEGDELVWMHQEMACSYSMKSRSVVCRGQAVAVTDMEEKRRILTLLMRHYTSYPCRFSDPAVRNVCIWAVKPDSVSARAFGLRPSEVK